MKWNKRLGFPKGITADREVSTVAEKAVEARMGLMPASDLCFFSKQGCTEAVTVHFGDHFVETKCANNLFPGCATQNCLLLRARK